MPIAIDQTGVRAATGGRASQKARPPRRIPAIAIARSARQAVDELRPGGGRVDGHGAAPGPPA